MTNTKSTILITGGLGNLGAWLTEYFFDKNFEVWVLTKNFRQLVTHAKYHLIHADLADYNDLNQKLEGLTFDYVIHAGSVNDGFVPHYYQSAIEVNTLGTRNLLEWAKDKTIKHIVYFSTFQVYGKYSGHITEETATMPVNDYGATHLFAEYYFHQLHSTHKLGYTIIRLTNSYGCPKDYQTSKWYLVLNDLSKAAFEKKEIVLKSNGKAPRDFIWMGDVCHAIYQLFSMPPTHTVYNLSGERTHTMLYVAECVQNAYQKKFGFKVPIFVNENDTTVYSNDLFVSSQKIRKMIALNTLEHFEDEAGKIFDFLANKPN